MSIFDMLAKAATGGNSSKSSRSSSSYASSGYSTNRTSAMMYQCRYCGQRTSVTNPAHLPTGGTGCRARGKDSRGHALNHVWERL
ncbi:MAG: hypothetical protein PUC73_09615 [Lachnospiraceae bacterium]|nr:hypothetical protein [Lachnospiraceae bacterium]